MANSERGLANVDVLECEALEQRHLLVRAEGLTTTPVPARAQGERSA